MSRTNFARLLAGVFAATLMLTSSHASACACCGESVSYRIIGFSDSGGSVLLLRTGARECTHSLVAEVYRSGATQCTARYDLYSENRSIALQENAELTDGFELSESERRQREDLSTWSRRASFPVAPISVAAEVNVRRTRRRLGERGLQQYEMRVRIGCLDQRFLVWGSTGPSSEADNAPPFPRPSAEVFQAPGSSQYLLLLHSVLSDADANEVGNVPDPEDQFRWLTIPAC